MVVDVIPICERDDASGVGRIELRAWRIRGNWISAVATTQEVNAHRFSRIKDYQTGLAAGDGSSGPGVGHNDLDNAVRVASTDPTGSIARAGLTPINHPVLRPGIGIRTGAVSNNGREGGAAADRRSGVGWLRSETKRSAAIEQSVETGAPIIGQCQISAQNNAINSETRRFTVANHKGERVAHVAGIHSQGGKILGVLFPFADHGVGDGAGAVFIGAGNFPRGVVWTQCAKSSREFIAVGAAAGIEHVLDVQLICAGSLEHQGPGGGGHSPIPDAHQQYRGGDGVRSLCAEGDGRSTPDAAGLRTAPERSSARDRTEDECSRPTRVSFRPHSSSMCPRPRTSGRGASVLRSLSVPGPARRFA